VIQTNTQRSALVFHTFNVLLYMYIRFPHYALILKLLSMCQTTRFVVMPF